jgi:hypothetical protein
MPHNPDKTLVQFFLTIAFVIMVAVFNWFKRRSQSEEPPETGSERKFTPPNRPQRPQTGTVPPPIAPRPPPRKTNWEEELRRLLEGESTPAPPPVRETAPAPPPLPAPTPVYTMPLPAPIRPVSVKQERRLPVELAELSAAPASQLDERVAERLRQIANQVERHAVRPRAALASLEVAEALALVRNPRSLRSAVMASVILGPPKALQM